MYNIILSAQNGFENNFDSIGEAVPQDHLKSVPTFILVLSPLIFAQSKAELKNLVLIQRYRQKM